MTAGGPSCRDADRRGPSDQESRLVPKMTSERSWGVQAGVAEGQEGVPPCRKSVDGHSAVPGATALPLVRGAWRQSRHRVPACRDTTDSESDEREPVSAGTVGARGGRSEGPQAGDVTTEVASLP